MEKKVYVIEYKDLRLIGPLWCLLSEIEYYEGDEVESELRDLRNSELGRLCMRFRKRCIRTDKNVQLLTARR